MEAQPIWNAEEDPENLTDTKAKIFLMKEKIQAKLGAGTSSPGPSAPALPVITSLHSLQEI